MHFDAFEKKILLEVLKTYFHEQEMEWLLQDENGHYYTESSCNNDRYAVKVANTITSLITKINSAS